MREEAFFFDSAASQPDGERQGRLFGVLHRPTGRSRRGSGWVFCHAWGAERTHSHRLMFESARALAREGYDVLRFDCRGAGESSGARGESTLDDHVADAACAAAELERRAGVPCRGMLGLRLGATVAARAARELVARESGPRGRECALVMWEPVAEGRRFSAELLRTAMANELVLTGVRPRTRVELEAALSGGEAIMIDGHPLTRAMFASVAAVDLEREGRPTRAPVLIAQIDPRPGRAPAEPLRRLRDAWARGGETELRAVRAPPAWLRVKEYDWRPRELLGGTLEWVRGHQAARVRRGPSPASARGGLSDRANADADANAVADVDERPVEFRVLGERARGVAHLPRDVEPGVPAVAMLAAGDSCRSSLFYVPLARALARDGWPVLRFDPRGIGDSDGDLGCATVAEAFRKIQLGHFVPDCLAAVDFMERELGRGTSVLTGLCGGAITAVYASARDPRVVGTVPLELRLERTPLERFRFGGTRAQYLSWAQLASSSRRTLFLLSVRRGLHWMREVLRKMRAAVAWVARHRGIPGSDAWFVSRLGPGANTGMLRALKGSLERGVPSLCIFGETEEPRMFESVRPGLTGARPRGGGAGPLEAFLERRVIEGADHNFVARGSTERLFATLGGWLSHPERPWAVPRRAREAREEREGRGDGKRAA